jgi:hypothetical protein
LREDTKVHPAGVVKLPAAAFVTMVIKRSPAWTPAGTVTFVSKYTAFDTATKLGGGVGVTVGVAVGVAVFVGVGVTVGVAVAVAVGALSPGANGFTSTERNSGEHHVAPEP